MIRPTRISTTLKVIPIAIAVYSGMGLANDKPPKGETRYHFEDIATHLDPAFEIQGFSFFPGVGFIDFDNDSWVDIYVINGTGYPNALYRNNGDGTFTDVSQQAGVDDLGQGAGVAIGDVNNDGFDDIYLAQGTTVGDGVDSNDGPDRLFVNNGDGSFREIAEQAGIEEYGFTTSVGFADYDSDGDLDIVVGRFIDFDFNDPVANRTNPTVRSHLYRNNGDLTFTEVSDEVGVGTDFNTWAVAWFDYDNDDDVDLFLAHEQGPISVFNNDGTGEFTDVTSVSGDVKDYGAWMGLAIGDYNNDGWIDMYATNISDLTVTRDPSLEPLTVPPPETWDNPWPALFRNNGDGTFTEVGEEAGVSIPQQFSWGTFFADVDNDGWLDLYVAQNFAPVGVIGLEPEGAGPGRLFINQRDGSFVDRSFEAGVANFGADGDYLDARGVAFADIDKDGRIDFFLQNALQFEEMFPFGSTPIPGTGTPRLFNNLTSSDNHWLELRLIGTGSSNRNAIGAKVRLQTKDSVQVRTLTGGESAFSQNERLIHFGLGASPKATVDITWPDGAVQRFRGVPANQRWTIVQGLPKRIPEVEFENSAYR